MNEDNAEVKDAAPVSEPGGARRDSTRSGAPPRDVVTVREQLLDWMIIIVSVVGAPMAITDIVTLITKPAVGFAPVYFVVYLSIVACALLRRRLSFTLRGAVLLLDLFVIGATMLATRALTGAGDMLLAAAAVLTTVLFGLRTGLIVVVLALGVYTAAALAFSHGILAVPPEMVPDLRLSRVWFKAAVIFLLFVLVVVISPGILQARLADALQLLSRRTREIERAHRDLRREVEDRQRAERAKRDLEAQLLQSQKLEAIGRLAGGVAHDFNNILTGALGGLAMARRLPACDEAILGRLEGVERSLNRAAELTRQLLAFSRKQVIELKPVDINAIVRDVPDLIGRLIGEDIRLQLVPGAHKSIIKADAGQLQQVLTNLVVNARDAMPKGGDLYIATSNALIGPSERASDGEKITSGAYLCLTVTDSGAGMGAEVLSHIFEPFFTTKAPDKGSGLGLAMVHGIVNQHGGAVRVRSIVGEGTSFELLFPVAEGTVHPLPQRDDKELPEGTETVLVVEDEPLVREVNEGILGQLGYHVLTAKDGREALSVATAYQGVIHLLLTDVVMPEMNGNEVANHLLKQRPDIKILFCSGYTDDIISRHGVLEPSVHFLAKPFTVFQLARKVRDLLDA